MTGHSSEAPSSDEYYTSTSDTEPEDESAAQSEIDALAAELQEITNKNAKWEVCVCTVEELMTTATIDLLITDYLLWLPQIITILPVVLFYICEVHKELWQ